MSPLIVDVGNWLTFTIALPVIVPSHVPSNTDTIEYMKKYKGDKNKYCLFLDPPWSGVYYKTENELDLFLGNMNILDIIKMIDTKYICIKAPSNYNFKSFYKYFYLSYHPKSLFYQHLHLDNTLQIHLYIFHLYI